MRRRLLPLLCAALVLIHACHREPPPERVRATLSLDALLGGADTLHDRASEPRAFSFPADHGPHPSFRTEWWYFTGNVTAADGREFGYQLTFFRSALSDSASFSAQGPAAQRSSWRARHAYMAHFAVSDITGAAIHTAERFARGALGLAGARGDPFAVWLDRWQVTGEGSDDAPFPLRLTATADDFAIDLVLARGKPVVLQGVNGLSRKGPEPGNASYYYSFTRLPTQGTVRIGGRDFTVRGASWLDREWSTSVLSDDLAGWDWMALQFADSTELMLYRLRRHDGTPGPFSAGTFVAADGSSTHLSVDDFVMTPLRRWDSPHGAAVYPVGWRVEVPSLDLTADVDAAFDAQELNLAVRYWEGAVRVSARRGGQAIRGRGYLELTGYATGGSTARGAAP